MVFALVAFCFATHTRGAEDSAREIEAIYRPFRVAEASLAPDGKRVAFLVRGRTRFDVALFETADLLGKSEVTLPVSSDANPVFFAWMSPHVLVAVFGNAMVVTVDTETGESTTLMDRKSFPNSGGRRQTLRPLMLVGSPATHLALELATSDFENRVFDLQLVRLDLRTGLYEVSPVRMFELPGNGELLVDRQARPRVVWSHEGLIHRLFLTSGAQKHATWRPLDRVCTEPAPLNFSVTPETVMGERSVPLGFGTDPQVLYFASNVGRDTRGIYALNLRTGRRTDFALEDAEFDLVDARVPWGGSPLVFDRARGNLVGVRCNGATTQVRWLDAEIGGVERALEKKFPDREIQAIDWDDQRVRFLVWIGTNGDPGRYFVYDRETGRCTEYLKRHPALEAASLNVSEPFVCAPGPDSPRIHGYLTLPHAPAARKPPLVIWLHDAPGGRAQSGFDRDAQALAAMGLVVAQMDYAGSAGYGLAWERAIGDRPDEVPLANVAAVIRWLDARGLIDVNRVAVVGEGLGGYLALRSLESQPELLRSAVAINAPLELGDLRRDFQPEQRARDAFTQQAASRLARGRPTNPEEIDAQMSAQAESAIQAAMNGANTPPLVDFQREFYAWYLKQFKNLWDASVLSHDERIRRPVLLLYDPAHPYVPIARVRELYGRLQRRKQDAAFAEIPRQFAAGSPQAREQVVQRIAEFLNVTLYDFDVKLGETKEVK